MSRTVPSQPQRRHHRSPRSVSTTRHADTARSGSTPLPRHLQPQVVEQAEGRQIRASEGNGEHVGVFLEQRENSHPAKTSTFTPAGTHPSLRPPGNTTYTPTWDEPRKSQVGQRWRPSWYPQWVPASFDGEALRRARLARALTHHQLARLARLGAGERIRGFERGIVEPTARVIVAMAKALSVDPMQLLLLPEGVDLRALRLASGQSPAELAESVHVSLRTYLKWESGFDVPLEDDRIRSALTGALSCSNDQMVTALQAPSHVLAGRPLS